MRDARCRRTTGRPAAHRADQEHSAACSWPSRAVTSSSLSLATVLAAVGRYRLGVFDASPRTSTTSPSRSVSGSCSAGCSPTSPSAPTPGPPGRRDDRVRQGPRSAAGITAGAIGIISYLTKFNLSRGFFVLLFVIGVPLLLLWRWTRASPRAPRPRPRPPADAGAHLGLGLAHRRGRRRARPRVVAGLPHRRRARAVVHDDVQPPPRAGCPSSASAPDRTADAVRREKADLVVFTEGAFPSAVDFRRIAWDLEGHHVQMAVVPSLSDISSGRMTMRPVGGVPLVHVEQPQSLEASPRPEARLRPRRRAACCLVARPAAHDRVRDRRSSCGDGGPGALPPDPRRARRRVLRVPQVAQHGRRRRGPALRRHAT